MVAQNCSVHNGQVIAQENIVLEKMDYGPYSVSQVSSACSTQTHGEAGFLKPLGISESHDDDIHD